MKKLHCLIACLMLASCSHKHQVDVQDPTRQRTEHNVSTGMTESYSDMRVSETKSDYEICLDENAGYGDAEASCDKRFKAGEPSDGPNLPSYIMSNGLLY